MDGKEEKPISTPPIIAAPGESPSTLIIHTGATPPANLTTTSLPSAPGTPPPGNTSLTPQPEIKNVGGRNIAAVFLSATEEERKAGKNGVILEFSDREQDVLKAFLSTCDYEKTAKMTGLTAGSVKRMLRRPNLKRYLQEILEKAAIKEGTDRDWITMQARKVWEGEITPKPVQMEALRFLEKLTAPSQAQPGPTGPAQLNQTQINYYNGLTKEQKDAEWIDARRTATGGV